MILLKKFRLINWYGFSNVTAPIGFFTLIAGKTEMENLCCWTP